MPGRGKQFRDGPNPPDVFRAVFGREPQAESSRKRLSMIGSQQRRAGIQAMANVVAVEQKAVNARRMQRADPRRLATCSCRNRSVP